MKTMTHRKGVLLASLLLGGWMIGALPISAQEQNDCMPGGPGCSCGQAKDERVVRPDVPEMRNIRQKMAEIADLRRDGKHQEAREMAERVRREVGEHRRMPQRNARGEAMQRPPAGKNTAPQGSPRMKHADTPREKVRHLQAAASHLKAAGYEKQADEAGREIERILTELRRESEAQAKMKQAEAAKAEKRKAGEAGKDAGTKPATRPSPDAMRDEMNKMRRELKQLRRQLEEAKMQ